MAGTVVTYENEEEITDGGKTIRWSPRISISAPGEAM
jgi:hypothetical protein